MTLEEKVNELLLYQRRQRIYAIVRTILYILVFIAVVILPIWGFYFMLDYLRRTAGIDLTQIGDTLKNVKSVSDMGALDSLKSLVK